MIKHFMARLHKKQLKRNFQVVVQLCLSEKLLCL